MTTARTNLYRGINAHLHSALQHEDGGWKVFHNKHISDLAEALDAQLPPGYEVGLTKSLQIVEYHPDTGERLRRPEPDVSIYDLGTTARHTPRAGSAPTLTLPALETLERDEESYLTAVFISHNQQIVLRLELLSPTNKPPGDGYLQYREKRNLAVEQQIPLVELDYLHESRCPIRGVPSYPDRQRGAHPYVIAITDARPFIGQSFIYGFDVDAPIPVADLPLAGDDLLTFDFGAVYQHTFASLSYFSRRAHYAELPAAFDTYSTEDQTRIRDVMRRAAEQQTQQQ